MFETADNCECLRQCLRHEHCQTAVGTDGTLMAPGSRVAKGDRAPTLQTLPATATANSFVRVTGDTKSFNNGIFAKAEGTKDVSSTSEEVMHRSIGLNRFEMSFRDVGTVRGTEEYWCPRTQGGMFDVERTVDP